MRTNGIVLLLSCMTLMASCSGGCTFCILNGDEILISSHIGDPVVGTAIEILEKDLDAVLSASVSRGCDGADIAVVLHDNPICAGDADVQAIAGKHEAFVVKVLKDGGLLVAGSDSHGAAFGVMELSRMLGVSPWEWWADSTPSVLRKFSLKRGFSMSRAPSVAYRGIFINDEDFALILFS